jgi:hypothetical protein
MKSTMTTFLLLLAATGVQAAPPKKAAAPAKPPAVTIPKDAVPNADGTSYTWTDKDGKKWVFAKTPFGVMKSPASEAGTAALPEDLTNAKAIDKGETVRFERPGPFGTISWEKKKTDLPDDERRVFAAQNGNAQAQ